MKIKIIISIALVLIFGLILGSVLLLSPKGEPSLTFVTIGDIHA